MDKYLLSDSHEWSGHWWLPSAPDDRVAGVLSFDPEHGLTLRLIGGWAIDQDIPPEGVVVRYNRMPELTLVHGMSAGQLITLVDVFVTKMERFRVGFRGPSDATLVHAMTAVVGCHLDEPESAVFEGAIATIENLSSWSRLSGLRAEIGRDDDGTRVNRIALTPIEPLLAECGDVVAKLFDVQWSPSSEFTRWGTRSSLRETASIQFTSDQPRSLADWIEELRSAGDLISLCGLSACGLMSVRLLLPATPERYSEDDPRALVRNEVYVVQQRIVRPDPSASALEGRHFAVTLDDFDFDALMQRWFEVRETFSAARGMILGLKYVPGGYVETQLIAAVAAAESLHRALQPPGPVDPAEFKQLRADLLAMAPVEHREWVASRLPRNEPSLKDRLLDLARRPGEFMCALVPNAERWATATKNARNDLAHQGQTRHSDSATMAAVAEVTMAVVALNLLHELGAPSASLADALGRQRDLRVAVDLAEEYFA